ncbi:MAG: hypothetical protein K0R08_807 [Solimicrobium sp.]|nr:hypothetical protein [Solimicrobium sp.]
MQISLFDSPRNRGYLLCIQQHFFSQQMVLQKKFSRGKNGEPKEAV